MALESRMRTCNKPKEPTKWSKHMASGRLWQREWSEGGKAKSAKDGELICRSPKVVEQQGRRGCKKQRSNASSPPIPGCRKQGAVHGLEVQEAGWGARVEGAKVQEAGWGIYSTLNRKKKALSSEGNSRQILPSTTDTVSGFTVKGVKVCRSADSMKKILISTLPASFRPMV